ncbi:hypothetical protein GQ43DRAFT_443660 [Delitschia confertaspora ATCC 74209]|uniref:Tautomerase cis-CaaD-like domain-containing protein n=1 Tax=Delitschia confertaspora ATCC 74209 TaxID=1513339 RepID=A0A9P4MPC6_9PLEO|nr:hypothetical protein GQ43DRAFT_443660 [Delitschia confertaspora ATCC 74209]
MPLWQIFHPPTTFQTSESKSALARDATALYARILPAFYVNVIFTSVDPSSFYIGGISRPSNENDIPFIRIFIQNIARTLPSSPTGPTKEQTRFLTLVDEVLKPHIEDKGYEWEYHAIESSKNLWKIQGMVPPEAGSEGEEVWRKEGKAVKL